MALKAIYAGNDLDCGVGPIKDRFGVLGTGFTIRAWLSVQEEHSTASPAPAIHADLDITLTESTPTVSADYTGVIDKAKINLRLIDAVPTFVGRDDVYLHREDTTGYHTVERCKVYAVRRAA